MPVINHNSDLSIYRMVLNRLPFIEDTPTNTNLISHFTLEVMWELEPCFKIGLLDDGTYDEERVGQEQYYAVVQQSIIADIVSTYILLMQGASSVVTSNSGGPTPTLGTFLKRAKAGPTEVEYDQFDMSALSEATTIGLNGLLEKYYHSAIRRAALLGCHFDICSDCSLSLMNTNHPFAISAPSKGCWSCGS